MDRLQPCLKYTVKQYKVHKANCNNDLVNNVVNPEFNDRNHIEVVVNLFNPEIIGFSAGANKTVQLVYDAFLNSNINLSKVRIFHTDRGSEFKNKLIDQVLTAFNIKRSLSHKDCSYDNAVGEATYKIIKTEFVFDRIFNRENQLRLELAVMSTSLIKSESMEF